MKTPTQKRSSKTNGKITLKLGDLVAGAQRHNLQGRTIVSYPFIEALRKLSADPMPVRERYAAGRTLKEVIELVTEYEKRQGELIKQFGRKQSELLKEEIERQKAELKPEMGGSLRRALEKSIADNEIALKKFNDNPDLDGHAIAATDTAAMKLLNEALDKEVEDTISLSYLDHRIALALEEEGKPGSALTGSEMILLDALIETPA
jgi:hypothetical protein